VIADSSYIATM